MWRVTGMRRYGKDFKAIAETIGNKTEGHLRNFFVNYRRRYNLDDVLAEYEKEHGVTNGNGTVEEVTFYTLLCPIIVYVLSWVVRVYGHDGK
jgi:hypothetical protein